MPDRCLRCKQIRFRSTDDLWAKLKQISALKVSLSCCKLNVLSTFEFYRRHDVVQHVQRCIASNFLGEKNRRGRCLASLELEVDPIHHSLFSSWYRRFLQLAIFLANLIKTRADGVLVTGNYLNKFSSHFRRRYTRETRQKMFTSDEHLKKTCSGNYLWPRLRVFS